MSRDAELSELVAAQLVARGIRPTAQRIAVAAMVLSPGEHQSAERVIERVGARAPRISRATVYNTIHLLVKKDLVRPKMITGGTVIYDPNVEPHHHFVDEATGKVTDLPWSSIKVGPLDHLPGIDVTSYEVVVRGRRSRRR
jgi:Fur family iron response transcriptional regulator